MKLLYGIIAAIGITFTTAPAALSQYIVPQTYPEQPTPGTILMICGDHYVYMIDVDTALDASDWHDAITWSWDAHSISQSIGLGTERLDHLDECKLVDNGTKMLVTSSYGWGAMIEYPSGKLLFYTTKVPNAHSADLLPGNLIAIGCSDGEGELNNSVHLYKSNLSNESIGKINFQSTHGVVWNAVTERLYVAGSRTIGVYRLTEEQSATPQLIPDHEVTAAKSDIHDLLYVNPGKITVAGKEAYLYDIAQKSFRNIPALLGRMSLKSLNMNPSTGEMWYTDMTDTANIRFWFTHELRWIPGRSIDQAPAVVINIPDINVYKVRVASWGNYGD